MINTTNRQALQDIQEILHLAEQRLDGIDDLLYKADHIALDIDPHHLAAEYTAHLYSKLDALQNELAENWNAVQQHLDQIGEGTFDPGYKPVKFVYYDADNRRCNQSNAVRGEIEEED